MNHSTEIVKTTREQIRAFCRFASEFKNDHAGTKFPDMPFEELRKFLKKKYLLEEGEQILRPKIFAAIGGDCDDAFIFCASLLLFCGVPAKNIYAVEARADKDSEWTHILCAVADGQGGKIYLDCLPESIADAEEFYGTENLRARSLAEFI